MLRTFRRSAVAALVAAVALGSLTPAFAKPGKRQGPKPKVAKPVTDYGSSCIGDPLQVNYVYVQVGNTLAWGVYAMPAHTPKGIVVFAHGHGHTAESWRQHVSDTAKNLDVIAVAMNYRNQVDSPGDPLPTSYGWRVKEGAEDSIAAAKYFEDYCKSAKTIVMYGVSMGGNTAGLAVAAKAKREDGRTPLFDYWFDIEGATNVTETYLEAKALAVTGNSTAVTAVKEIEEEFGGPLQSRHEEYLRNSVVTRAEDIKASGIKGVVMVHGVDDGLVGYNQSPEMAARLRQVGIPVDFWTAITHGPSSEPGTTLDGYVTGNIPGFQSPFAGHASEVSKTHIVGATGFARLAALFDGVRPACRYGVLDGTLGVNDTSRTVVPTC